MYYLIIDHRNNYYNSQTIYERLHYRPVHYYLNNAQITLTWVRISETIYRLYPTMYNEEIIKQHTINLVSEMKNRIDPNINCVLTKEV